MYPTTDFGRKMRLDIHTDVKHFMLSIRLYLCPILDGTFNSDLNLFHKYVVLKGTLCWQNTSNLNYYTVRDKIFIAIWYQRHLIVPLATTYNYLYGTDIKFFSITKLMFKKNYPPKECKKISFKILSRLCVIKKTKILGFINMLNKFRK